MTPIWLAAMEISIMFGFLRALFPSRERREFQEMLRSEHRKLERGPPALPPANTKYILYVCEPRYQYDVYDGKIEVGEIRKLPGDEDHDTYWFAGAYEFGFDYFRSFKEARAWLGDPPIRHYR